MRNVFEEYYHNTYENVKIDPREYDLEFNLEHKITLELIGNPKNKMIVDLGCNTGILLEHMRKKFPDNRFMGLDISKSALSLAKKKGFICYYCDVTKKIPLKDESVDIMISTCVIAHIFETDKLLQEVYRVLKKDGYFILTTPNFNSIRDMIKYMFLGFTPTQIDHEHIRLFNPKLLTEHLIRNRLKPVAWNCYAPIIPLKLSRMLKINRYIKTNLAKTFLSHKIAVKTIKQ